MKTLLRLAKKSAKNIQKKLLKNGKPFCKILHTEISVTKLFLNHITYTKKRTYKQIVERLLVATFLEEIFHTGEITEIRENTKSKEYKISYKAGVDIFSLIIMQTEKQYLLISCFLEYKKRDLSQPSMVHHAQGVQVS